MVEINPIQINPPGPETNATTIASSHASRLRHLAASIHSLGPAPLFHLLAELSSSPFAMSKFERYAGLSHFGPFIDVNNGAELPPPVFLVPRWGDE